MQYKFLCETFRLFIGSKSIKYVCGFWQKEKEAFKISSFYVLILFCDKQCHIFTQRLTYKPTGSKGTTL